MMRHGNWVFKKIHQCLCYGGRVGALPNGEFPAPGDGGAGPATHSFRRRQGPRYHSPSIMSRYILDGRTLVLNRSWAAISTTSVRNALGLVYRDVARVVCPETFAPHDFRSWAEVSASRDGGDSGDEFIQAVAMRIRVPEVVVLRKYNGFPRRGVAFSRRNLYRRDEFTCQYCGAQPGTELLSIDHVIPRSRGGTSTWENCVLACLDCNKRKASRTLEEAGIHLRRPAVRPPGGAEFEVSLGTRRRSWERFISERYWNVELQA